MSIRNHISATALAVGICMTGIGAGAMATVASPAIAAPVNVNNIDPAANYSMTLTKYLGGVTGQSNDGTAQTVNLPTLKGVTFDVYKVSVDLSTNAGWTAATDLQGHPITAAEVNAGALTGSSGATYTLTKVSTITTDAAGKASYTSNGPGLYLVNENLKTSTSIVNNDTGAAIQTASVTSSVPFLVTLPMTSPDGSSWMNDVAVYPKNQSDQITKAVTDKSTTTSGDTTDTASHQLDYAITTTITPGLTGSQMGTYVVIDNLEPRLTFDKIDSVAITGTAGSTLVPGVDYQVYVNGVLNGPGAGNDVVQVVMTPAGLDKLAAAKLADPSATVITHELVVANTEGADGIITTDAQLIPNKQVLDQLSGTTGTVYDPTSKASVDLALGAIDSNDVTTHYGDAVITKVDGKDRAKVLPGAVFDLFQTTSATMTPTAADCADVTANGTPIATGLTTGADGKLSMTGLQESDFYNGAQANASYVTYCLVETKAPTVNGVTYNKLAQPVAFVVNDPGTTTPATVTVANEPRNLSNSMPTTGGTGAAGLGLLSVVLIGGAATVVAIRRRNTDHQA